MTDISDWHLLIERKGPYAMIPLNEYQMANLLDALAQARDNGDWYGELQDIIGMVMKKQGIENLISNRGIKYTREQVQRRALTQGD